MLSILSLTQEEFSEKIFSFCGRGKRHAALLYAQWMREGKLAPASWAEPQAQSLVEEIIQQTDFSLPELSGEKEAGSTSKFLLRFSDGLESESVAIPMEAGITLCISSQVGCKMGCAFCETGRMGLLKNLSAADIVAQVFIARFIKKHAVRNIVFMGMGEPLDNFENVIQAIQVLMDPSGLNFGPSRITVSTSGHVPHIYKMIDRFPPALNLAISVNAPNDEIRNRVMPVNKKWNMAILKEAMQAYGAHPRRQILIEYVLMQGINDSLEHAAELAAYLSGLPVKVNLIPYNAQSRDRFSAPTEAVQEVFTACLKSYGYQVLLRRHKGRGIMAACGQLGNLDLRKRIKINP